MVIDRSQRKAGIAEHALDDPAERRILVAHMGDDAVAVEIVVGDGKLRPFLDVTLAAIRRSHEHDVAQIEIRAGL